jgi:catechol 2,3-dioxygenase-like lactoylglutathione lyase family enzyme
MNFKINHLQHIGVPVTDIKISEAFYNTLGFKNVMGTTFDFNGEKGSVAMMQRDDMIIEIYQMPVKELAEIKNRKDGHIDHIAFDVDDIDTAFTELKNAGFHVLEEKPAFLAFWKNGCRYFNITGPDGERIEFNQIIKPQS